MRIVSEYRSANGKHALALVEYPAGSCGGAPAPSLSINELDRAGRLTQAKATLGGATVEQGLMELARYLTTYPAALAHHGGEIVERRQFPGKPGSVAAFKRYMRQPGAFSIKYLPIDASLFPCARQREDRHGVTFEVRSGDMIESPRGIYHDDPHAGAVYVQDDGSFIVADSPTPRRYIYEGARA